LSKPSASKRFKPAGWVVAVAVLAVVGVAGSASLRTHSGSAAAKPAAVAPATPATPALNADQRGRVRASLGTLPLAFEANQGQTDPQVKYMARGNGYTIFLTANDTVFALSSSTQAGTRVAGKHGLGGDKTAPNAAAKDQTAAIHMHLVGGNAQAQIAAGSQLPGHSNYFIGNDRSHWHADVAQYARVSYRDVYPGVNMTFYGVQKQLEFDFIIAPGASPAPLRLGVSGANKIATDHSGNLVLASSAGDVLLQKPVAYQQKDGARRPVEARFVLQAGNQVSFELGDYDRSRELVIDPSVSYAYSTYLGGTGEDDSYAIAFDNAGDAYVTGQTKSTNFPTVAGAYKTASAGGFDVFVTKIKADGSSLVYSTYVGGSSDDSGNAIAVDGSGNAFVAGGTGSSDFPTTTGALQTTSGGGVDAFVFELASSGGSLTYSTYLGGSGADVATGLALAKDGSGDTFVVGSTFSLDFPITTGAVQTTIKGTSNGFVTKLNSSGNAKVYSTYLGGGSGDFASAVAVDSSNNAYVTGATPNSTFPVTLGAFQTICGTAVNCNGGLTDAFVTVINAAGSNYVYSTFLGGAGIDEGLGIAVDASGDAYVTGLTQSSTTFPVKLPALQSTFGGTQDAFVTELNPSGSARVYSTFLGGSLSDAGTSIALDGSNNAYVTGQTNSTNFPKANATQSALGGGNDAFVSEISASGSQLLFSTYLGGALNENTNASGGNLAAIGSIAVDNVGANIYVTGNTASTDFPTTLPYQLQNGGGTDAFVTKYTQPPTGPDFTIAATALAAVPQGGSTTSTITIAALNGYTGTVNFTCLVASVSGGTPLPTCSIPNAVTGGAGTSTMTVKTTGAAHAMNQGANSLVYAMWLPVVGLSLVGMRFSTADSRRKKLLGFLLLGLIMAALFFLPACGGGSGGGGGGCTGCTPKGSYTVTVTGKDSVNANLTNSVTPALTLTVN
jgi:Beta-propeller repeat